MLALHLLQISLVYVNTLMIQDVLRDPVWLARLTAEDYRRLTPHSILSRPVGRIEGC